MDWSEESKELGNVHYFVVGEEKWKHSAEWPPSNVREKVWNIDKL